MRRLSVMIALLLGLMHIVVAQNETIKVQAYPYQVYVDGKSLKMTFYQIEGELYCKMIDAATALKGTPKEFHFTKEPFKSSKRPYDLPREVYHIKTASTLTAVDNELVATATTAQTSRAYLYVDDFQRPTMAYSIAKSDFFKLLDLMRILDVNTSVNSSGKSVKITTSSFYEAPAPLSYTPNNASPKWVKVPAHTGVAVAKLLGYFDTDNSTIIHRRLPTEYGNYIDDGITMMTDLISCTHRYLPFDQVEFNYDDLRRRRFEGWCPVSNFWVAMGRDQKGELILTKGCTYINSKGAVINPSLFFTSAGQFRNGYAVVTYLENGVDFTGVIDAKGDLVLSVPGKYERALFYKNILQVETLYHKDHNKFIEKVYYNIDGKRLYLTEDEFREMQSPGYDQAEKKVFDKFKSKYSSVYYCGYNRFIVEKENQTSIVDKNNTILFQDNKFVKPIFAWNKLFFQFSKPQEQGVGVKDMNGRVVIPNKYTNLTPVNGEAFMTIINNRAQSLIGLNGQVIASSPNAPLWALDGSDLITLREYLFDVEIVPGDVVMIYSNMDLSRTTSTQGLKVVAGRHKYAYADWMKPTYQQVQTLIQQPSANALHLFALENFLEGWFRSKKPE